MTYPLTPEGVDELAHIYAEEYRISVDRMKELIGACESFDPSHRTLVVALALLNQHVTTTTIMKAVTQAGEAVAQQPECYES